jgi:glycosyltransferase involved in cell wall biosynthesis
LLRLLAKHPDATLTVVGCSPRIEHKNIRVLGKIPLEKVDEEYSKASIFCMPTRQEPFGIAIVEAMHRKLPVVSTNIGAMPDMVTNGVNGFLLVPDDVDGFYTALLRLLNSPELCESMGMESKQIANEKYRWNNTGTIISGNIKRVLNQAVLCSVGNAPIK